jgi:hypothetical protein
MVASDFEESNRDCPKCGETLAERSCDAIYCGGGTVEDPDDDWRKPEPCDECNGTGFQVWCRSCGWDVTDGRFLSPRCEAEWLAKQEAENGL